LTDSPPQPPPDEGRAITIRLRRTHLWAAAGVVVGIGIGVLIGRATTDDPRPILYGLPAAGATGGAPASDAAPVKVDTTGRPARGPADAKVTMVEFVDFECPFCGRYARDTLPRIHREYGDRIRYVSRHFPLSSHRHAEPAALAAECAHEQGRYWQLHEELFAHQDALDEDGLTTHARKAGVNMERYTACLRAKSTRARVQRDLDEGRRYGITGTPTFFINGRPIRGAQPYEQIKAQLDDALKAGG
jgi:protein-disulfide isomerase